MDKIIIITPPSNRDIIVKEDGYKATNKPYTRNALILSKFEKDVKVVTITNGLTEIEHMIKKLGCVDEKYLLFLKNAYTSFRDNGCNEDYISPNTGGLVSYHFTKENKNIERLPHYLRCGYYGDDFLTPIFEYTYETTLRSAFSGIIAAEYIRDNNLIYCANIFPGHHSTNSSYSGYCFLNNAAICAKKLLETYPIANSRVDCVERSHPKIAILDIDYHHGDGTQKIFYNDNNVLTVSLHADPRQNYPFYTGFPDEIGEGNGFGFNYNYFLGKETNLSQYKSTLAIAFHHICKFNPDVLIIAFGADTVKNDPEGGFLLEPDDYTEIGKTIRKYYRKKIIVTQEGGYDLIEIDDIVYNFLSGLS